MKVKSISFLYLISIILAISSPCFGDSIAVPNEKNEIICNEVSSGFIMRNVENSGGRRLSLAEVNVLTYWCILDPVFSRSGVTKGIRLELQNIGPTFEADLRDAIKNDMPRLVVRGGKITGSTLILPDHNSKDDLKKTNVDADEDYSDSPQETTLYQPTSMEWQPQPSNGVRRRHLRQLAVNQFGTKRVLVFRITGTHNRVTKSPTASSSVVSDAVFGTVSDSVNLRSQYSACSYNQIDMAPASGPELDNYLASPGVIDISVQVGEWKSEHLSNAVIEKAEANVTSGGFDLDLEDYDHVLYHMPPDTIKPGLTIGSWVAYASKPGFESWYNDDQILYVSNQMHEVGHNLDMHHSGDITQTGAGFEYGDTTCSMGFGAGVSDTHKCFNSAKMFELEWYSDRVVSIDPARRSDIFYGKVIGVSDYNESTSNHTLVVEIKSFAAEEQNTYLTYNRAEGINADTGEHPNKVTVVRGGTGDLSVMVAALDSTSTTRYTISDFFNGRDLFITVVDEGSDGTVEYATVEIELEVQSCAVDSECTTSGGCFTALCVVGQCDYNAVVGCCGNGLCEPEAGENCGTCPSDCIKPDHCNDAGYYLGGCTGAQVTSGISGNMFDIEAVKDITIFAFEVRAYGEAPIQPEVYFKKGTWIGSEEDPSVWTNVLGNVSIPLDADNSGLGSLLVKTHLQLQHPVYINAGETVGFYITMNEPARQWYRVAYNVDSKTWDAIGDLVAENDELKILAGSSNKYPFGPWDGPNRFIGRPKYLYGSSCYNNAQCDDLNMYTSPDTCDLSTKQCQNPLTPGNEDVCGNKICEPAAGENCSACPSDCNIPFDCNEIGIGKNPYEGWYLGNPYSFSSLVYATCSTFIQSIM